MQREKTILAEYLSLHGLRMTEQREAILNEFLLVEGHQSAEDLTAAVKKKDKTIGQATVYRNLRLFVQSGVAREVQFGDGVTRYEHNVDHDHHDHIMCERCGKTVEAFDPRIEELQDALARRHGFLVTGHVMCIYGICAECRDK